MTATTLLSAEEFQERTGTALRILGDAHKPETSRADLSKAVGYALDALQGDTLGKHVEGVHDEMRVRSHVAWLIGEVVLTRFEEVRTQRETCAVETVAQYYPDITKFEKEYALKALKKLRTLLGGSDT